MSSSEAVGFFLGTATVGREVGAGVSCDLQNALVFRFRQKECILRAALIARSCFSRSCAASTIVCSKHSALVRQRFLLPALLSPSKMKAVTTVNTCLRRREWRQSTEVAEFNEPNLGLGYAEPIQLGSGYL